jgi:pimeloyl-ACP methyl ester carboxylesterase
VYQVLGSRFLREFHGARGGLFYGDLDVRWRFFSEGYFGLNNDRLQGAARSWAKKLGAPYIFIGRPGTYGSSGDHMQRRRPAESLLISAALDKIKARLGIKEFIVAGQSGGGHVTSSLLTHRSDIVCAVPTSAPSSPRVRWTLRGLKKDTTGYTDSYEPTEHLQRSKMHEKLRVFVLGDPSDANVVWPSQVIMAARLKQVGIPVEILSGEGTGTESHWLGNSARIVAGWCANDLPTDEIVRKAAGSLRG